MREVTAVEVAREIKHRGILKWRLRECSICGSGLFYYFSGDYVAYDPSCNCGSGGGSGLRSYDEVARTLNMQKPEVRKRMWCDLLRLTPAECEAAT